MPQQTLTVSADVRILVRHCQNRVTVVGWDHANSVASDSLAQQEGNKVLVEDASKVTLRVPRTASVTIQDCEADIRVGDLDGRVEIENIEGDVALRNLRGETIVRDLDGDLVAKEVAVLKGEGPWEGDVALRDVKTVRAEEIQGDASLSGVDEANLDEVEGSLVARDVKSLTGEGTWEGDANLRSVEFAVISKIEGDASIDTLGMLKLENLEGDLHALAVRGALSIEQVDGNVNLRDVSGPVSIRRVGGDLIASNATGPLDFPEVEGDTVIALVQETPLNLRADGDVVLNLPAKANAEIELDAPRGDLVARADIKVVEEDKNHLRGTIGQGGVKIHAETTGGDLIVSGGGKQLQGRASGEPFAQLGQEIAAEVRQSVRESLGDLRFSVRHGRHRFGFQPHRHGFTKEPPQEVKVQEKSTVPEVGSPERKEILDAIARGELSVDDAIRKLTGEE